MTMVYEIPAKQIDDFQDSADWIRSARLAQKAEAGDEEAVKELERRGRTKVRRI